VAGYLLRRGHTFLRVTVAGVSAGLGDTDVG
jgi:hypothetical protein